jgi:hypothetical protein
MGRSLNQEIKRTPLVQIVDKDPKSIGRYFVGILKGGPRIVRMKRGSGKVYELTILDTNAPLVMKNDKGGYSEVEVAEGDLVSVFAPTALAGMLDQAKVGEKVRFEYTGLKQTKKGTDYHSFTGEVL